MPKHGKKILCLISKLNRYMDENCTLTELLKVFMERNSIDLSVIHDQTIRKHFTKFRLGDHKLQIEVGRHHNIPLAERICTRCCLGAVEDEYHALLHCNDYAQMRDCYFPKVRIWSPHIDMLSSEDKFAWLMNNLDEYIIVLTAKFISYIMKSHITK